MNTVVATVGGQSAPYTPGANSVAVSPGQHLPFLLAPAAGEFVLKLEDLAAMPGQPPDWDYDDRSWVVSVTELTTISISPPAPADESADGARPVVVELTRSNTSPGSLDQPLYLPFTLSGTATPGVDYIPPTSNIVVFWPGEAITRLVLPVIDDGVSEDPETVIVHLDPPVGVAPPPLDTTITITDPIPSPPVPPPPELPTVSVAGSLAGEERADGLRPVVFHLSRTNPGAPADAPALSAGFSLSGTAGAGVDYVSPYSLSATFAPGQLTTTVVLSVIDDALLEDAESLVLTLLPSAAYTIGTSPGTANILDDDTANAAPGSFWWKPLASVWGGTAGNWLKGPGEEYGRWTRAPGAADHLYYRGDVTQAYCVLPAATTSSGNTYASMHLLFSPSSVMPVAYAGTVTVTSGLAVGTLEVDCGQIAQGSSGYPSGNGTTLTITSALDWTGGTLNSNTVAGTIALAPGATGVAEPSFTNPGIDGTVYLGSTLELGSTETTQTGSTLDVREGLYNLLNDDAAFVVKNRSLINLKAPVPDSLIEKSIKGKITIDGENKTRWARKGGLEIEEGGVGVVRSVVRPDTPPQSGYYALVDFTGNVSKLKNSGVLTLKDYSWIRFNHTEEDTFGGLIQTPADPPDDPDAPPPSKNQQTQLEAGTRITCKGRSAVTIDSGSLVMTELKGADDQPLALQQDILIEGSNAASAEYALWIASAGKIQVPNGRKSPLKLQIDGRLKWTGEIQVFADHTAFKNDVVSATGRIIVEKDPPPNPLDPPLLGPPKKAKLSVVWFDASQGEPVSVEGVWTLVRSTYDGLGGAEGPPEASISKSPTLEGPADINTFRPTIELTPVQDKIEMKPDNAD